MNAACVMAVDENVLSPAELVAHFTTAELLAASTETSNTYNGRVLAKATVIAQVRLRCPSVNKLAQRMGIAKTTVYRWCRACPISQHSFDHAIRELAFLLYDGAQHG